MCRHTPIAVRGIAPSDTLRVGATPIIVLTMMPGTQTQPREPKAELLFEATLTPHRSLPPLGFLMVMSVLIGISVAIGIGFSLVGAWPVIGFLGIDILLVYLAFRISYAAARQFQHVRLSSEALEVLFRDPGGGDRRAVLQPYWARVEVEPINAGRGRLVVRSRGEILELGAFLANDEKLAFAQALAQALRRARDPIQGHGLQT